MSRTEEQTAADEELTKAIERCAKAYEVSGQMIGDYVVVAAIQGLEEDDSIRHSYSIMVRDNNVSGVMAIGLLEIAAFDLKMGTKSDY